MCPWATEKSPKLATATPDHQEQQHHYRKKKTAAPNSDDSNNKNIIQHQHQHRQQEPKIELRIPKIENVSASPPTVVLDCTLVSKAIARATPLLTDVLSTQPDLAFFSHPTHALSLFLFRCVCFFDPPLPTPAFSFSPFMYLS